MIIARRCRFCAASPTTKSSTTARRIVRFSTCQPGDAANISFEIAHFERDANGKADLSFTQGLLDPSRSLADKPQVTQFHDTMPAPARVREGWGVRWTQRVSPDDRKEVFYHPSTYAQDFVSKPLNLGKFPRGSYRIHVRALDQ